ncbi:uncharacterized protein TM35_000092380 [Trypanosoma theileri]|uniref:Splicing factor YJU2 n=1 Tax=Trypanosoma theileri TaxID=67003 RepID=A0A1X0P065_9TRYP|nr:uncharacterized protein TM35_000092380 [Trypanosoma theileri]ORC90188.1 hypothetical protein TM35_000092380 [Trypanosoma theileri]
MAKINATYSSGYYLAPDTDYRKLEDEQERNRKRERREGRQQQQQGDVETKTAIRQTFAIPFNIICLHCNRRIARGTHGYVNRRATEEKYMGIRIWELEFRCIFCKGHIYLKTDYETAKLTGGYHCSRNCRRGEGDFYGTNQINEEVRAQQAAEEAEKGTLEALERENEAMRELQERERLIEELVESRAGRLEEDTRDELLNAIQSRERQRQQEEVKGEEQEEEEQQQQEEGDDHGSLKKLSVEEEEAYQRFEAQLRSWREEAEKQQSKDDAGEEARVAAVITAKYSTAPATTTVSAPTPQAQPQPQSSTTISTSSLTTSKTMVEKRQNVFMNDSDSDSDGMDLTLTKKERDVSKVVSNTSTGGTSTTTTTTTTTTTIASRRRKSGVLSSLLDD